MTERFFLGMTFRLEDQFCSAVNAYVSHNYDFLRHFYLHIPNENSGGVVAVMKSLSMGVLKGAPDFYFLHSSCPSWWLELKLPTGRLSDAQKKLHALWRSHGEIIHVAWHPREVSEILRSIYGKPKFGV